MPSPDRSLAKTLLAFAKSIVIHSVSVKRLGTIPRPARHLLHAEQISLGHAITHTITTLEGSPDDLQALLDAFTILHNRHDVVVRLIKMVSVGKSAPPGLAGMTLDEFADLLLDECSAGPHTHSAAMAILATLAAFYPGWGVLAARSAVIDRLIRRATVLAGIDISVVSTGEIRRSISFPPALKQAAIGILNYFGEVIERRYPDINVGVTIEQERERVTLIVRTPQGTEERIERELEDYGRVVTGDITPEDYLGHSHAAMALRHKLELAALEVRQTKQLLESERVQFGERIGALEEDVRFLRTLLDRDAYERQAIADAIRSIMDAVRPAAQHALERVVESLASNSASSAATAQRLATAVKEDPSILRLLQELLLKGAVQGAAGNYLYALLQAVSRLL